MGGGEGRPESKVLGPESGRKGVVSRKSGDGEKSPESKVRSLESGRGGEKKSPESGLPAITHVAIDGYGNVGQR